MYSEGDGGSKSETGGASVSGTDALGTLSPGVFGMLPDPVELDRAVSAVERRAFESPDGISALVAVAETECGWWLLSELVAGESPDADDGAAAARDSKSTRRDPLVESIARTTGRPAENVWKTLHASLLPTLLVTDLVRHVDSVAAPPEYTVTIELRSDDDREFVSAVLLLVAAAVLLAGAEPSGEARSVDRGLRDAIERFSIVVWRIRKSARRAREACERAPTGR